MTAYEYCRTLGDSVLCDMERAGLIRPEIRRYVYIYGQVLTRLKEGQGRVEAMEQTGEQCYTSYGNIRKICRMMEADFESVSKV